MKQKLILLNLIITISIYGQNIDYNKYESSKNEDLSYKVYLDNQNSNNIEPFLTDEDYDKRRIVADYKTSSGKYSYADKGIGVFVNKKKTGEWNYYFNGKLKEKSNYFEGLRQGPTFLYKDNGQLLDTLYYHSDFVDGMLNLDKMSNYMEYLRDENTYSKNNSKFLNGEWIETSGSPEIQFAGKKNGNNKRTGIWVQYGIQDKQKTLVQIVNYENGVRIGKSLSLFPSGEVKKIEKYKNGLIETLISYYPNGKVEFMIGYVDELNTRIRIKIRDNGFGEYYYKEGFNNEIKLTRQMQFSIIKQNEISDNSEKLKSVVNEALKNSTNFNKTDEEVKNSTTENKHNEEVINITTTSKGNESEDNDVYNSAGVDKRPSFIGGNGDLNAYVNESFNNKSLSGKIFVSFVIEKDGNLSSLKVDRDLGEGSGVAVIRILNLCKNCWSPAEIKDKKVRCSYSLPITINN